MTAYLIRRFLTSLVILLGVSFVVFALLHTIYPSPAIDVLGIRTAPLSIAAWNKSHGFDDPFIVQYFHYLNRLAHGNLGYSYKLNQSVARLFGERWARSAWLSGSALFLAVVIAVPLGIYQAVRRNTAGDNVVTTLSFVAYAMPDFFFYLMAVQVLALTFPVFSFQASQSPNIFSIITDWRGMTLPILSVTLLVVAGFSRYMRSTSMDTWPRTTLRRRGPGACRSGWCCAGTWCATRACRW